MLYFYLNFIECVLPCPLGYEPNSACNGCVPANICVTNDSCQNGGTCNIGSNNNVTVNTTACVANIFLDKIVLARTAACYFMVLNTLFCNLHQGVFFHVRWAMNQTRFVSTYY